MDRRWLPHGWGTGEARLLGRKLRLSKHFRRHRQLVRVVALLSPRPRSKLENEMGIPLGQEGILENQGQIPRSLHLEICTLGSRSRVAWHIPSRQSPRAPRVAAPRVDSWDPARW